MFRYYSGVYGDLDNMWNFDLGLVYSEFIGFFLWLRVVFLCRNMLFLEFEEI